MRLPLFLKSSPPDDLPSNTQLAELLLHASVVVICAPCFRHSISGSFKSTHFSPVSPSWPNWGAPGQSEKKWSPPVLLSANQAFANLHSRCQTARLLSAVVAKLPPWAAPKSGNLLIKSARRFDTPSRVQMQDPPYCTPLERLVAMQIVCLWARQVYGPPLCSVVPGLFFAQTTEQGK